MLVAIIIIAVVTLVAWNFFRFYTFYRDYRFDGSFQGQSRECMIGGLNLEARTLCMIGADKTGLYLLSHPKPRRIFWGYGYAVFKKRLFIPWEDISCRSGNSLLKKCIWFDLAPRRMYLDVPKDIGEQLLEDAGRKIPI
jgi:hypothetical protein